MWVSFYAAMLNTWVATKVMRSGFLSVMFFYRSGQKVPSFGSVFSGSVKMSEPLVHFFVRSVSQTIGQIQLIFYTLHQFQYVVCFNNLDQGSKLLSKFSLPESMKHTVE